MFKFFKDFMSASEKIPALRKISEEEKNKTKGREYAQEFAVTLIEDIGTLEQFFNISPKIGRFGSTVVCPDTTIVTMPKEFMPGVLIKFYIKSSGITGFEFIDNAIQVGKCKCQDSNGVVCGKQMTEEEIKRDGMCQHCADNVFNEMSSYEEYNWSHKQTGY